jgi:dienelactone hydrolase
LLLTLACVSTKTGYGTDEGLDGIMAKLIRTAGVTVALVGVLATVAAAPSHAVGTRHRASKTQVIVQDVRIPVHGQPAVSAYLVRSAGSLAPRSHAGILFLHWLGQIHSDRTEFLAEATELAPTGAVSLLPQGVFPWTADPAGNRHDVTVIKAQLAAFRACLNWLLSHRYVDRSRVAVVGHDYGAMYGALLAQTDKRVHTAVLAAPDATWGHWFVKYWLGFTGPHATRYDALFRKLQPVRHVSRLGTHELFQWAGQDIFINAHVRNSFAQHAPKAKVDLYPTSDHQLTDGAQVDRDAFLKAQLSLSR